MSENVDKTNMQDDTLVIDVVGKLKSAVSYVKQQWLVILIVSVLGALLGLSYSILKKPTYTAVCTFVLEDDKSNGLGQMAGIASLAGLNIGDAGNGGGIFQGNNILELYKSRLMIEKALLSTANLNGKSQLLIDRYADSYGLRDVWKEKKNLATISFNGNPDKFNRDQDSIITSLVDLFNKKVLNVNKVDIKLNIIKVEVETKDELFSKCFTEQLVQNVNDFYSQTKTKKSLQNFKLLQRQADSVRVILNSSIYGVASAIDAAPNANPLMSTLKANSQKKQVDVQANTAIYSEVVKNLELTRMSMRQDMPLIQVIDKPVLPLAVKKIGKSTGLVVGFMVAFFVSVFLLVAKKIITML